MSFQDSMALADGALFEELGEMIYVGEIPMRGIRQPDEAGSSAADGGFAPEATAKFEISMADFLAKGVRLGVKVRQGTAQWRVVSLRHKGGTMELVCAATSGQGGRAEF